MKLCRKCKVSYEDPERNFCTKCGNALEEVNICPNCHTENSLDFAFCKKCGTKLDGSSAEERVPSQASTSPKTNADGTLKETSHINWGKIICGIIVIVGIILAINKDSIDLYLKYSDAKSSLEKDNYIVAVDKFSALGNYKDSKALMYSAMASYIKNHKDNKDSTTRKFMQELKNNSPASFYWNDVYESIYGWKVEIINLSKLKDYYKQSESRTFYKGGTYYLHFRVIGGETGERARISYKILTDYPKFPTNISGFVKGELYDGNYGDIVFNDLRSDHFSIKFFDEKGQIIGSATFRAEGFYLIRTH